MGVGLQFYNYAYMLWGGGVFPVVKVNAASCASELSSHDAVWAGRLSFVWSTSLISSCIPHVTVTWGGVYKARNCTWAGCSVTCYMYRIGFNYVVYSKQTLAGIFKAGIFICINGAQHCMQYKHQSWWCVAFLQAV